jgi:cyclohexa-1,5-dienecarbonyl-CoA hydratase
MNLLRITENDGVATLTLDHPPLNIMTRALMGELREALDELRAAETTRVLIVTAQGRHFSAGADIGEHLPPAHRELIPEFLSTVEALAAFPFPTIAAVRGRCLGGGLELALACDLVIAADDASLGQPEIALALTAPAACALLPRRTSHANAAELLFGGDVVDAPRALAMGLVQRVVPAPALEEQALAHAKRFARHSAAALRATKASMRAASGVPLAEALRRAGDIYVHELMAASDPVEGLEAFLAKRAPVWRHR